MVNGKWDTLPVLVTVIVDNKRNFLLIGNSKRKFWHEGKH
jgi:hypothetical protein